MTTASVWALSAPAMAAPQADEAWLGAQALDQLPVPPETPPDPSLPGSSLPGTEISGASSTTPNETKPGDDVPASPLAPSSATGDNDADARPTEGEEILFSAERAEYDRDQDVVTVSGNVRMNRAGYNITADTVTWDRKTGKVQASGNVILVNPGGDAVYSETANLEDGFRDGAMDNLLIVMANGARLAARTATRNNGVTTLNNVAYTPCPMIDAKGCAETPSWQINAARVVYDPAMRQIRFEKAQLEMFGIPLFTIPHLTRPFGGNGHSGLLSPDVSYRRGNGVAITLPYYHQFSPNRDLTITPAIYSRIMPVLSASYRQLTKNGAFQISGGGTYSRRIPPGQQSITATSRRDFRFFLDTLGRFQLNPDWNVHYSIRLVTDRTFMRRYGFSREDRLRSDVTLQRITPRNLFSVSLWGTETLRPLDPQNQQPMTLPAIDWRHIYAAPQIVGGQVEVQLNSVSVVRSYGQDTFRNFAGLKWNRRFLLGSGQQLLLTGYGRGDLYVSSHNDRTKTLLYRGKHGTQGRGIIAGAAEINWPLIGGFLGGMQRLTPRIQLVTSPHTANLRIPNEDSRSIELETTNLFALNRFPGYDRWESGTRTTYGFDWAVTKRGFTFDTSFGQSYRLSRQRSLFPDGVGLRGRFSDFVGKSTVRYRRFVAISYGYRIDKQNMHLRRSVVDLTVGGRETFVSVSYLKLNRDIGPELEDLRNREEVRGAARLQLTRFVSVFGSAVVDLSNHSADVGVTETGGSNFKPVRSRLGIAYSDDCLDLGFTWRRDYATTGDAKRGDAWLIRLAFRGFGR